MALQIWLPLNGNLNNQGLNNTTFTGSTTFEAGKLGQAGVFGTAAKRAISSATVTLNSQVTIAFWIKIKTWVNWGRIFNLYNSDKTNAISCVSNTSTDKRIGTQVSKNGTKLTDSYNGSFDLNTWYHFAMVVNGTTKQHYINGSLVGTATLSDSMVTTNYTVMCGGTADSGTPVDMDINDFRVYDNALSPKEIEILSRGLVCHYPLSGGGRGGDNIMPNSYSMQLGTSSATNGVWRLAGTSNMDRSRVQIDGNYYAFQNSGIQTANDGSCYGIDSFTFEANTTYTMSMSARITAGTEGYAGFAPQNATIIGGTHTKVDKGYSVTPLTTSWKRLYITFTTNSLTARNIYIGVTTGSTSVTTQMALVKIEKGDKPTPWIPNSADTAYTAMGYNSTTEYDVSGYGYNGTKNGIMTYSSDTARYNVSTEFSKTGYIMNSSLGVNANACTINLWVKPKTATSQHFLLGTFDGWTNNGIGIYRENGGTAYKWLVRSGSESSHFQGTSIPAAINEWGMFTLVYTGTTIITYKNGIKNGEHTYGSNGVVSNPVFMIANSKFNSTPASENEEAFISDVRFYATALSAEQVAELYNTAVSVANNGTLLGYELVEV